MNRSQLEHVIRAAAAISGDSDIVVIGSQSVLGQFPSPPPELCVSIEADVYPRNKPELADLIDGSIGEMSPFHQTFGYYAQGVAPETAALPTGWESRLVALHTENTQGATGWCLEIHDLVLSKYIAGREKDLEYVEAALRHGLVRSDELLTRLPTVPVDAARRELAEQRIRAHRNP